MKEWNGEFSSPIANFDAVIVTILHTGVEVKALLNCSPVVFDCSGKIKSDGVHYL